MLSRLTRRAVLSQQLLIPCTGVLLQPLCCRARQLGLMQSSGPSLASNRVAVKMNAVRPLTLVLLGDIMLGRLVDDSLTCDALRKTAAFGDVLPFIHSLDPDTTIIAGNLECAITSHSQPTPKAFNFKLSPGNADVLQQLCLGFVATANNHVLDYGQPGLKETDEVLERLGVGHAGSGLQPAASQPAAVVTPGGHSVAFLSYSDHYQEWAATADTPGINYIDPASFDLSLLQQQVAAARVLGPDLVVVLIHWGPNYRWQPDQHLRALGKAFLDAGADLVFGTSPHHIQGVELLGRKAIIYSGGSFIDDYASDDHYRNQLSAVFVAEFVPAQPAAAAPAAATGKAAAGQGAAGQAAPAATTAAAAVGAGSKGLAAGTGSALVLRQLQARPIAITHHWREGSPPYFSQVDFAQGPEWEWVAGKLQQLSRALGNTRVAAMSGQHAVSMM